MSNTSLISVLMGVYYRSQDTTLLERSVQSILNQTIRNLEVLICDDGSSSEAKELLDRMAQHDQRIQLIRPGEVYSLPCKLNVCLKCAKGDWIARMDDDDYSYPERLKKQLHYLQMHSEIDFVGCNVNLVQGGKSVGIRRLPELPSVRDFYFVQPFVHPTLLFRREAFSAVGGYSENRCCILCEDYDLLMRMYKTGCNGANLQEVLFDYSTPADGKGNRKMRHRWNEAVTRYQRFKELGVLREAWPYIGKPVVVGMIPGKVLKAVKRRWKIR